VKKKSWGITAGLLFLMAATGAKSGEAVEPASKERDAAERALMQGQLDTAVAGLRSYLNTNPKDAEELADAALSECDAAVQNGLGGSSSAQDWLGRACGQKAQNAGPITGYRLARRVQAAFERSVELDPKNDEAVDDLGEYYIAAPMIVGGGVDKAEALAERELKSAPQAAHRTYALAAEANKDYNRAEYEFRAAVMVAGRPDAWADLGHYYARRKQYDQAVETLQKCQEADTAMDATLVDAASILVEINREIESAEKMLRGYLAANAKSDAAPAFKVHELLGSLLLKKGDKAGAKIEYQASLALAHDYAPVKKALQSL
jgi:tetratricopeptide (TPR) repeat protein